jgi:hypothetical protein
MAAEDDVERVRASFLRSLKKSTGTAVKGLSMSKKQRGGFCISVWCLLVMFVITEKIMKRPVF